MSNFQRLPALAALVVEGFFCFVLKCHTHPSTTGDLTSAIETFAEMRQCSVQASVVSLSAARPYMAEAYTPLKVNSSAFEKLPKPNKEKKSSSKHFSFSGAM